MNNTAIISGTIRKVNIGNFSSREIINLTIVVKNYFNGKELKAYIPVQITMPALVQKYKNLLVEGMRISVIGRFETYSSNGKTGYNITQVNSVQLMDLGDVAHAIVWGRICNEPESRVTVGGHKVLSVNLANTRTYKKGDEWVNVDSFIPITAWDNVADMMEKFRKGQAVWIEGRVSSRTYENKKGEKVYVTELIAESVIPGGSGKRNMFCHPDGEMVQVQKQGDGWTGIPQENKQPSENRTDNSSENRQTASKTEKENKIQNTPSGIGSFPQGMTGNTTGNFPASNGGKPTSFPKSQISYEDYMEEDEELPFS